MPKLYELLETKNRKLQEQRVEQLMGQVAAPVVDLIIRWDARFGTVKLTTLGIVDPPLGLLYDLLGVAREVLDQQKIQEQVAKQQIEQAAQTPPANETSPELD